MEVIKYVRTVKKEVYEANMELQKKDLSSTLGEM